MKRRPLSPDAQPDPESAMRGRRPLVALVLLAALGAAVSWPARAEDPVGADPGAFAELYKSGKLFDKAQYKAVRAAFARRFEQRHAAEIDRAFGDDRDALASFLAEESDLREDFYTALDEEHDKVGRALALFRGLWIDSPEKVKKFGALAVAVAVTWDDPRGVYDYRGHQVRTHSTLPGGLAGPADNFRYLADGDTALQTRAQLLPWEFLVYLVDHRTPLDERRWAQEKYGGRRAMAGKCFGDIAYDKDMLQGRPSHLEGHPYTLENIRRYGGVCAMQADFAARVSKSVGVPAAWVWGPGKDLGLHSWVMWVELKQVSKTGLTFSLESHGRYDNDLYYTGKLTDPQTGREILDRDMERRLWVVGHDRVGKRQAELAMRAFPELRDALKLDVAAQLAYLDRVLRVSAHNESAWLTLAHLAKGGGLKGADQQALLGHIPNLIRVFNRFPDFTWKAFDDLLAAQPDAGSRAGLYAKLVEMYELAGRPDLACEARLKLADLQVEQKRFRAAAEGIAFTVRKFPGEGRYVPRMMARLHEICDGFKGGSELLGRFYLDVLPAIPRRRGDQPSQYCIRMYEQAVAFFKEHGKDKVASTLEVQLAQVRGGSRP
jgi:hypothetical protein